MKVGQESPFSKAIEVFRTQGLPALVRAAIQASGLYRRMIVYGGREEDWGHSPDSADVHCEELTAACSGEYQVLRPDQDPEDIRARQDRGDICLLVRSGSQLVASTWLAMGSARIEYLDCEIQLASDAAYGYDAHVTAGFRGKRVADSMTRLCFEKIQDFGCSRLVGMIWIQNATSLHRSGRLQFNRIGEIHRYQLGPWRRFDLALDGEHRDICQL